MDNRRAVNGSGARYTSRMGILLTLLVLGCGGPQQAASQSTPRAAQTAPPAVNVPNNKVTIVPMLDQKIVACDPKRCNGVDVNRTMSISIGPVYTFTAHSDEMDGPHNYPVALVVFRLKALGLYSESFDAVNTVSLLDTQQHAALGSLQVPVNPNCLSQADQYQYTVAPGENLALSKGLCFVFPEKDIPLKPTRAVMSGLEIPLQ